MDGCMQELLWPARAPRFVNEGKAHRSEGRLESQARRVEHVERRVRHRPPTPVLLKTAPVQRLGGDVKLLVAKHEHSRALVQLHHHVQHTRRPPVDVLGTARAATALPLGTALVTAGWRSEELLEIEAVLAAKAHIRQLKVGGQLVHARHRRGASTTVAKRTRRRASGGWWRRLTWYLESA